MEKTNTTEHELIERYAFILGKRSSTEDLIESFRETSEEMDCFSF